MWGRDLISALSVKKRCKYISTIKAIVSTILYDVYSGMILWYVAFRSRHAQLFLLSLIQCLIKKLIPFLELLWNHEYFGSFAKLTRSPSGFTYFARDPKYS